MKTFTEPHENAVASRNVERGRAKRNQPCENISCVRLRRQLNVVSDGVCTRENEKKIVYPIDQENRVIDATICSIVNFVKKYF